MNIPILYEDNHILIVEKPVNVPVQQDDSRDADLLSLLKEDLKIRYNKPGNVYLALLHRLDRPVGGAIVFAKTSKAASRMSDLLRKQEIDRVYYAIVRGSIQHDSNTLTHYLVKDRQRNIVSAVSKESKGAKKAVLHYEVLGRENDLSYIKVFLKTGRSHQIRVQLKEFGFPLYGDQKYGAKENKVGQQIALWSHQLSFIHPVKNEKITVQSFPPSIYPWSNWL